MFAVRRSLRNTVVKYTSPLKIITPIIKQKKPLKFEEVPYHEQYESRDNENEIKQRIKSYGKWYEESDKPIIRIERQKKIREFLQQY